MIDRLVDNPLTLTGVARGYCQNILPLLNLLVLMILFLSSDGNTNKLIICGSSACNQHSLKLAIETTHKASLLLGISVDMLWGILRQLIKFPHIFHYTLSPLLQFQKLLELHLHNVVRDMVFPKSIIEFHTRNLMSL